MRPVRKRGVYRAIKRGEPWALADKINRDLVNSCVEDVYASIMKSNPLLQLYGLSAWLPQENTTNLNLKPPVIHEVFLGLDRTSVPLRFSKEINSNKTWWSRIKSWFQSNSR